MFGTNERGAKTGTGGPASASQINQDRRERLRKLAMETVDLAKVTFQICFIELGPLHHEKSLGVIRM